MGMAGALVDCGWGMTGGDWCGDVVGFVFDIRWVPVSASGVSTTPESWLWHTFRE